MATEITSKNELVSISSELSDKISTFCEYFESMKSYLANASDYDGINVSGAANILSSNIENVLTDFKIAMANISGYIEALNYFDVDDFDDISFVEVEDSSQGNIADLDSSVYITEETADDSTNSTNSIDSTDSSSNSNDKSWVGATGDGSSSSNGYTGTAGNSTGSSSTGAGSGSNESYISSGSSSGSSGSSSSWDPSANVGDSIITTTMIITPSGKTSSDGRTQRSASAQFTITPGDPDNPDIDISKYKNNEELGFKVTTGNLAYDLCDEDIELLCAIVSAESDKTYDDALAVISTILNRCESSNWINSHGRDPIAQATAPNQYVVYQHGSYERYMDGNAPETVVQAVKDALAGVRNHKYTSFRSNGTTSYSNNMISPTGNRYL